METTESQTAAKEAATKAVETGIKEDKKQLLDI
jgi:phosphopantetheinyl transferase (holo-ACP synthase)